ADRLIAAGVPISLLVLAGIIVAGPAAGAAAWALFCVSSTFVALAQPAVGMAFPSALAGRALSAYNLVIFAGVFLVQWGIGLLVDAFGALGLDVVGAFRGAMAVFLACACAGYARFLMGTRDNAQDPQPAAP
ncbi:MAG: MFS transporter, partial [Ramlibacter sp.]